MNTDLIQIAAAATLAGTKPFPEIVVLLLEAGVESYQVDYVSLRKTFTDGQGATVVTAIPFEGPPPVAADFDAAGLRAAIHDSQHHGQKYRDFTRRAMAAGVQGYFAFLRRKRVTCFGRQGDQHTEWFPRGRPEGGLSAGLNRASGN